MNGHYMSRNLHNLYNDMIVRNESTKCDQWCEYHNDFSNFTYDDIEHMKYHRNTIDFCDECSIINGCIRMYSFALEPERKIPSPSVNISLETFRMISDLLS